MKAALLKLANSLFSGAVSDKEKRGKLALIIPAILFAGIVFIAVVLLIILSPVLMVLNYFAGIFSGTEALTQHPYQIVAQNIGCSMNYFDMNTVNLFESYIVVIDNPSTKGISTEQTSGTPELSVAEQAKLEERFRKYYFDKSTVTMPGDVESKTYCKLRFVTDIMDDLQKDTLLDATSTKQLTIVLKDSINSQFQKPFAYTDFLDSDYKFTISSHFTNYEFQSSVDKTDDAMSEFISEEGGHRGIDYAIPIGTPIVSMMDGIVISVHDGNPNTGLDGSFDDDRGNYITILSHFPLVEEKTKGNVMISYLHLSPNTLNVSVGQTVTRGQVIAYSGHSGKSTGSHLDLRVNYTIVVTEETSVWFDPYSITLNDLWMHPIYSTYDPES